VTRHVAWSLSVVALLGAAGCGGGSQMGSQMGTTTGPTGTTASGTVMSSVMPSGNAASVSVTTTVVMRFSHGMAAGMEQYMDLHEGDTSGPVVPMTCGWSSDRTTLTCQPSTPLKPQTRYTIHMGDGMMDADDHPVNMDQGLGMGGQWLMTGMMGGLHAGSPMGMMGSGWHGSNGSYGMVFPFTTA
jgi:hypothetical protein